MILRLPWQFAGIYRDHDRCRLVQHRFEILCSDCRKFIAKALSIFTIILILLGFILTDYKALKDESKESRMPAMIVLIQCDVEFIGAPSTHQKQAWEICESSEERARNVTQCRPK